MSKALTDNQLRILQAAAEDRRGLGVVEKPYLPGWEGVIWKHHADRLTERGLLQPYVHGGWEITDAGRAAIAKAEAR